MMKKNDKKAEQQLVARSAQNYRLNFGNVAKRMFCILQANK